MVWCGVVWCEEELRVVKFLERLKFDCRKIFNFFLQLHKLCFFPFFSIFLHLFFSLFLSPFSLFFFLFLLLPFFPFFFLLFFFVSSSTAFSIGQVPPFAQGLSHPALRRRSDLRRGGLHGQEQGHPLPRLQKTSLQQVCAWVGGCMGG